MDQGTSVIAKLKNKAKESGNSLQSHLQLFCQEEFLRRISLSKYVDNLILKGGLFIYTLTNFESRATVDVDFLLRQLPSSIDDIKKIVDEIINADTGNNFITFSTTGYEQISPQRKYKGVSFQIIGQIKNTKTPFNVDIGIGDVIVPKAENRRIPVQLREFNSPTILTYSLESTIAEKLDAILQRLEMTSRMKDFHDIYYLSEMFDFNGRELQEAIMQTLQNRGTSYEKDSFDLILALSEDNEMQVKWRQGVRRMKLPGISFDEVLKGMEIFLKPIWNAIVSEDEWLKMWNCRTKEWK